ncbi:MAG TPA: hypothetical protein VML75_09405 [Kofleriaceae bacterium]|nr:hypothetical protein [Kofleriaceae bacterium]
MLWLLLITGIAIQPNDPRQLATIDEAGVVRRSTDGGERWTVAATCTTPELEPELEPTHDCPEVAGTVLFARDVLVVACADGELMIDGDAAPEALALDVDERVTAAAHDGAALLLATSGGTLRWGARELVLPEPTRALAVSAGDVIAAGHAQLWRWHQGVWSPIAAVTACALSATPGHVVAAGPAGVLAIDGWRATAIDPRPHLAVAAAGAQVWISDGTAPRRADTTRSPWRPPLALSTSMRGIDRADLARRARRARWLPRVDLVIRADRGAVDLLGPTSRAAHAATLVVFVNLSWNLDGVFDADILPLAGLTP